MIDDNSKIDLSEKLNAGIVRIRMVNEHGNTTSYPYTSISDESNEILIKLTETIGYQPPVDQPTIFNQFADPYLDYIEAYNLVSKEWEIVAFEDVIGTSIHTTSDGMIDNDRSLTEIVGVETLGGFDVENLDDTDRLKMVKMHYYEHISIEDVLFLMYYKMLISVDDYLNITHPERLGNKTAMECIIPAHMQVILDRIDEVKGELDELKKQTEADGGTLEDLEDIDSIKLMFDDIPNELNLAQYTDWISLLDNWPAILQPSPIPGNIRFHIEEMNKSILKELEIVKFTKMLHNISNADQLAELYSEWENDSSIPDHVKFLIVKRIANIKGEQHV